MARYRELPSQQTILKRFDLKTIVEAMVKAAQGDATRDPRASYEERLNVTREAYEEYHGESDKFDGDKGQRTRNPPGDPEEPPEPTIFNFPSFTKGPDQTVLEDAGAQDVPNWATHIWAVPPETFIVTGNTYPRLFSAGPAVHAIQSAHGDDTGTLTYTPATHANGADITVVLRTAGNTPPTATPASADLHDHRQTSSYILKTASAGGISPSAGTASRASCERGRAIVAYRTTAPIHARSCRVRGPRA
jgi:hypothetical protein